MSVRGTGKLWAVLLAIFSAFTLFSCGEGDVLREIKRKGKLTVLTRNNAHCYYTYRDRPMGFEYDLVKAFSQHLGVDLEIITPTWEGLFEQLEKGEGDLIAASVTVTPSREERFDFSRPYLNIQQQVVIHKTDHRIREMEDLAGKTVHVRSATSYEERLRELQKEGLAVRIQVHDDTPTEELIARVAEKEIRVTAADSNIAMLNRRYYPSVRIAFPIGETQSLGWAVRRGERGLLKEIDRFFKKIQKDGTFAQIHEKYFANVEIFDYVDLRKFHRRIRTRLPKYKEVIREAADKHGFDWRLIAAMVYQESHFDPDARSYTGVEGIMQLTRDTARDLGIKDRNDPEKSIRGGVTYLNKLYNLFEEGAGRDRLLLALASYNVGRGHVLDAQEIAAEQGMDPTSWASIKEVLPLLRNPKYYKKTAHGYCRGTEPVRYVDRILTYYDILKREAIS